MELFNDGVLLMKKYFANLMMRLAFRVFRRYHNYLSSEINSIIWGEITRKHGRDHYTANDYSGFDANCSTCVRELEEERARQETIQKWLKGEMRWSKH
jgi:hypothetical protein